MMLNNNNMDLPMGSVHDTSGRCSPIGGSNDSKISFGFTQEQVECVCEVLYIPFFLICLDRTLNETKIFFDFSCRFYNILVILNV